MRHTWLVLLLLAAAPLAAQSPDILYYKFDETSGALAPNSAVPGQGFSNGTLSGAPVWNTADPVIGAASLNNTNQDRRMSSGYSMNERNGQPFTIEFWFRTNRNGYQDFCNDSDSFAIWLSNGRLEAWLGRRNNNQIPQLNGGTGLNDGDWHYAALTHDGNNGFSLYWGDTTGGLNSSNDNENTTFANLAFELLYWQFTVPATYDGEMDEFRLWSTERSQAQLQANRFAAFAGQDLKITDPNDVFVKHQGDAAVTNVMAATAANYTFTVENVSPAAVTFSPVTLSNIVGANASVVSNPSTVAPSATTTFTIQVTPLQNEFSFDIDVNNNGSPDPYQFTFTGLVNSGRPEMLYYRFNEGTGNTAFNDASPGRGTNPTPFSQGPNWITSGNPLGAAAAGNNADLDTGFRCTDLPTPEFTVEFWAYRQSGQTNTICGDGTSFRIYHQNQNLRIAAGLQGGLQDIDTTVNLPNNNWSHIAVVSDPGNYGLRVYQDGVLEFEQINYTFPFADVDFTVFSNGGGDDFRGDLDEFRFWAHARTGAEIAADMNSELLGSLEVGRPGVITHTGSDPLGNINVGAPQTLDYTLYNIGSAGLLLGNPAVTFTGASNCNVNVTSNPSGNLVAAAATIMAQVEVTPTGVGPFGVTLEFNSNDPDVPVYTIAVSGTGVGVPMIEIERPATSPIPHQGEDSVAGTVTGVQTGVTYTIRNIGTGQLNLSGWAATSQNNCDVVVGAPMLTAIPVSGSTTMQVDIAPLSTAAWSFTLEVDSNAAGIPTYEIDVSGTAASGGEIDVQRPDGNSIADGAADTSPTLLSGIQVMLTYTIENLASATGALLLNTPATVTANNLQNCALNITQPAQTNLNPGDTTTFQVGVTPSGAGTVSFQLVIGSDDVDESSYEVNFSTTATTPPVLSINTGPVSYGAWNVGLTSSPAVTHTITNTGGAPLVVTDVVAFGANAGDWSFTPASALPTTIPPSGTLNISGEFSPSVTGARVAQLRITSNSGGAPGDIVNVNVNGTGTQANVTGMPTSHDFGSVALGTSTAQSFDIENTGDGNAYIASISILGSSDFSVTSAPDTPLTQAPLTAGEFQVDVQFAPTSPTGTKTGTLQIVWGQSSTIGTTNLDIPLQGDAIPGGEIDVLRTATPIADGASDTINGTVAGVLTTVTYRIENNGTGVLTYSNITATNAINATVTVLSPANGTIAVSSFADIDVEITPTIAGSWDFDFAIDSDDQNENPYDIDAQGTASFSDIKVSQGSTPLSNPDTLNPAGIIGTPDNLGFTIFNNGSSALTLTGAPEVQVADQSNVFGLSVTQPGANVIPGSGSEPFNVAYTPAAANWNFTLTIDSDDPADPVWTINVVGTASLPSSITNVTVGNDTGGPLVVSGFVNGPTGSFIDVTVEYSGGTPSGTKAGALVEQSGLTISGNVIIGVPANTTVRFLWDAYATEGHVTASDYVVTLTPSISSNPGTPGSSAPFTLTRQGAWTQHIRPVSPAPDVFAHSAIFDETNQRMVIFGGKRAGITNEVWVYTRGQFTTGWNQLSPSGALPPARSHAGVVYDQANNRMVIFGGKNGSHYYGDTWALDLTPGAETWTQVATGSATTPPARRNPVMVMDAANDRALLFGGLGSAYYNNVWALDLSSGGADWGAGPLFTMGIPPSGRWGHAGAFDGVNNRLVIFGGKTASGDVNDVHELNLSGAPAWSQVSAGVSPDPRYLMTYGHDALNNALLVISGYKGAGLHGDVWYMPLSGAGADTWTQLNDEEKSVGGRVLGSVALDSNAGEMLVYGGLGNALDETVRILDVSGAPSWVIPPNTTIPDGREGGAMAFDALNDRLIVWGGQGINGYPTGTWRLDRSVPTGQWSLVPTSGSTPPLRKWMATSYDAVGHRMFIHGGRLASGGDSDDLWQLDLATDAWTQLSTGGGGARNRHAMVYDNAGNRLILFGGHNGGFLNDAWQYDLGSGTWTSISVPAGVKSRYGHAGVLDATGNRALFFHGHIGGKNTDSMWELDLGSLTWTDVTPAVAPPPRHSSAYAVNASGDGVWIHGGWRGGTTIDETWELQISGASPTWTQHTIAGTAPLDRYYHMAVIAPSGRLYIGFGKHSNRAVDDVWSLDTINPGAGWSLENPPTTPPALIHANVALDETNNRMIAFSGISGGVHDAGLWQLDLASPIAEWTQLSATGTAPAPRRSASIVFDDSGAYPRMILYGGRKSAAQSSVSNEVWELDLTSGSEQWTLLTTTIVDDPGARAQHTSVVDGSARMIVFGGVDDTGAVHNDIFALDLVTLTWSEVAPVNTPPVARFAHTSVYDAARDRMIVHGGYTGGSALGELLVFDFAGNAWSTLAFTGVAPTERYYHIIVIDPAQDRLILFGGVNHNKVAEGLFVYDLASDAWDQLTPPIANPDARWAYGAVWDSARNRMVMVGGYLAGQVESQTEDGVADTWFWGD